MNFRRCGIKEETALERQRWKFNLTDFSSTIGNNGLGGFSQEEEFPDPLWRPAKAAWGSKKLFAVVTGKFAHLSGSPGEVHGRDLVFSGPVVPRLEFRLEPSNALRQRKPSCEIPFMIQESQPLVTGVALSFQGIELLNEFRCALGFGFRGH